MSKDTLEGNLKKFQGQIKEQWGKLTDNDLKEVEGRLELLIGKVQERHGIAPISFIFSLTLLHFALELFRTI